MRLPQYRLTTERASLQLLTGWSWQCTKKIGSKYSTAWERRIKPCHDSVIEPVGQNTEISERRLPCARAQECAHRQSSGEWNDDKHTEVSYRHCVSQQEQPQEEVWFPAGGRQGKQKSWDTGKFCLLAVTLQVLKCDLEDHTWDSVTEAMLLP